jgi:hypothetical protein
MRLCSLSLPVLLVPSPLLLALLAGLVAGLVPDRSRRRPNGVPVGVR